MTPAVISKSIQSDRHAEPIGRSSFRNPRNGSNLIEAILLQFVFIAFFTGMVIVQAVLIRTDTQRFLLFRSVRKAAVEAAARPTVRPHLTEDFRTLGLQGNQSVSTHIKGSTPRSVMGKLADTFFVRSPDRQAGGLVPRFTDRPVTFKTDIELTGTAAPVPNSDNDIPWKR